MTRWQRVKTSIPVGMKRIARMVWPRYASNWWLRSPNSDFDFYGKVGDGTGSSTVMAPLLWIARTFPEAPCGLWEQRADSGQEDQKRDHPMLRLLQRPNPFYTGPILWMATLADWCVDGNAYWLKIRNGAGVVQELWWVPHWVIEPKGDELRFIEHYEYRPGMETVKVSPKDVVHFRFGVDSEDVRKGYSPLKSVLREVYTDDEAANFTASLLRNMGVPGLIVSPANGQSIPPESAKAAKDMLKTSFTGDNRGEPIVMTGETRVEQFGFSPNDMLLKELRRIPEERVSAVLGVPAIVAGLGAGLDRSTFTNYSEAREAAYEQTIIPTQRILAEDIRFQLLTDFMPLERVWGWRVGFDLSKVRVLQEDAFNLARRLDLGVRGGWAEVAEARHASGLEVRDSDRVFLRQMNLVQVPADGGEMVPLNVGAPANGNGNGADSGAVAEEVVRQMASAQT